MVPLRVPFQGLASRAIREALEEEWGSLVSDADKSAQASLALSAKARDALRHMGLPASLQGFLLSRGSIPAPLWKRVVVWQARGGLADLETKMQDLDEVAHAAMQVATEAGETLSKEEMNTVRFLAASTEHQTAAVAAAMAESSGITGAAPPTTNHQRAVDEAEQRLKICETAGQQVLALQKRLEKLRSAWMQGREADEKLRGSVCADVAFAEGAALLVSPTREALAAKLTKPTAPEASVSSASPETDANNAPSRIDRSSVAPSATSLLSESLLADAGMSGESIATRGVADSDTSGAALVRLGGLREVAMKTTEPLSALLAELGGRLEARDTRAASLMDVLRPSSAAHGAALAQAAQAVVGAASGLPLGEKATATFGAAVDARGPVLAAMVPLRSFVRELDDVFTSSNSPTSPSSHLSGTGTHEVGNCSEADAPLLTQARQQELMSAVQALNERFVMARDALEAAERMDETGAVQQQVRQGALDRRRAELLETALERSMKAWLHLEKGKRWYGDLQQQLEKVKSEIEDHACAQDLLRSDYGVATQQEDDDAHFARQLLEQLEFEGQQGHHAQLEQQQRKQIPSSTTGGGGGGSTTQTASSAVGAANGGGSAGGAGGADVDMTQLATVIPPGVGPGGKIKINLPRSGTAIELVVPATMNEGDTMQFLVPNAMLIPTKESTQGIIILGGHGEGGRASPLPSPPPPPTFPAAPAQVPPYSTGGVEPPQPPPAYESPVGTDPAALTTSAPGSSSDSLSSPLVIPDYSTAGPSSPPQVASAVVRQPSQGSTEGFAQAMDSMKAKMKRGLSMLGMGPSVPEASQRTADPVSAPVASQRTADPVNPRAVQQLMDMGFPKDAATAALIANGNDDEQALNALLDS